MPGLIEPEDVLAFLPQLTEEQAQALITGAVGRASLHAPCILDLTFARVDVVKAILLGAIVRWHTQRMGTVTSVSRASGPFNINEAFASQSGPRGFFLTSEINELKMLCTSPGAALPRGSFPPPATPDPFA